MGVFVLHLIAEFMYILNFSEMKHLLLSLFVSMFSLLNAQDQFKLLLYTQSDKWHSESIPSAVKAFELLSEQHQFKFFLGS